MAAFQGDGIPPLTAARLMMPTSHARRLLLADLRVVSEKRGLEVLDD